MMNLRSRTLERAALAAVLCAAVSPALFAQEPMPAMTMNMEGPLGIPLSRYGSGTSWLPDSTPMRAIHHVAGAWTLMLHGNAFLQYADEGGNRGRGQLGLTDWAMAMARRGAGGGDLSVRLMLSSEPLTVGRCGYPDLLASGESCRGQPLHDQQHPHDLFMELAAAYERAVTRGLALQLYVAPAGEPALGPVAFPHRPSALSDPIAPIGHHWLDATHISFGVVTAGLFGRRWKLEGSAFNGREPDERRYDLDLGPLSSYSGRLWLLPSPYLALQVSTGRLKNVERLAPGENITRTTASTTYNRPMTQGRFWATSVMWGRNTTTAHSADAILVETEFSLTAHQRLFARVETARKSGLDLALGTPALDSALFTVGKLSGGYERDLRSSAGLAFSAGVRGSVSSVPSALSSYYGGRTPLGIALYINLRPGARSPSVQPMPLDHTMMNR